MTDRFALPDAEVSAAAAEQMLQFALMAAFVAAATAAVVVASLNLSFFTALFVAGVASHR